MKDTYQVLMQKEKELELVQRQIEALLFFFARRERRPDRKWLSFACLKPGDWD